jgi:hypothetical protein
MPEILAALEGVLTPLYSFDESAFLVKILSENFQHQLIGISALPGGRVRKLRFKFRREDTSIATVPYLKK